MSKKNNDKYVLVCDKCNNVKEEKEYPVSGGIDSGGDCYGYCKCGGMFRFSN